MRRALDALDRLPETRRPHPWLVLLCLLLWLPGLRSIPATDAAESRVAIASRAWLAQDAAPAGAIHRIQAGAVRAVETLGLHAQARERIWAYRLPSLAGAILAVLATFELGRALVGRRAAFLAAALLAATAGMGVAARLATADAALLAAITLAAGCLGRAYLNPARVPRRVAAGFWLGLGAALLLGGPRAALVPLLAGVTLAVADRGWANGLPWLRALRPIPGLPVAAAALAAWALGGAATGWERLWAPPGLHLLGLVLLGFPATFLVVAALPRAWEDRLQPATRLLLAWAVSAWLLAEAAPGKQPLDLLPALPPLLLLAAAAALDPLHRAPPRWLRLLAAALLVAGAAAIGLGAVAAPLRGDGRLLTPALLALPLAAALAWMALRAATPARGAMLAVLLAIPLGAVVAEGVVPRLTAPWISPRLAALLDEVVPQRDAARIGLAGHEEPSAVFALGAGTRRLGSGAAAARFLAAAPGRLVVVADREEAAFRAEAAALGLVLREHGVVSGFNLPRGRWVAVGVFGVDG